MSNWSQNVASSQIVSVGLSFPRRCPRLAVFIFFYQLLSLFILHFALVYGAEVDLMVTALCLMITNAVIWVGALHATASVRERSATISNVLGYGTRRLFVSFFAALPHMALSTAVALLTVVILALLTAGKIGMPALLYVALLAGFINPWSVRLSLAVPILAAKDMPLGGVIGTTWRATRGHASLIFTSCYRLQILAALVNVAIFAVLEGYSSQPEDTLLAKLIMLPLSAYMMMVFIGSLSALAVHLVESAPSDTSDG